ncbi:MAG TPA: hypothetical protein VJ463_00655 [Geothrix sp.]|nr:hypothetical protein [Geothrix sp.]
MRILPTLLLALAACPAFAQTATFDEAFFDGDRRAILKACADKARSMKPKDAEWLAEYGRAYLAALDLPAAKAALKAAEDREPKDGKILRLIGNAWLKNGYKNEALEAYDKILERDKGNKDALTLAGLDLAEVAMPQYADKFMEALAKEEPKDWERFLLFGKAYLGSGLRKKAAYWFARAVSVKPDEEKVYLQISQAFAESQALL